MFFVCYKSHPDVLLWFFIVASLIQMFCFVSGNRVKMSVVAESGHLAAEPGKAKQDDIFEDELVID